MPKILANLNSEKMKAIKYRANAHFFVDGHTPGGVACAHTAVQRSAGFDFYLHHTRYEKGIPIFATMIWSS